LLRQLLLRELATAFACCNTGHMTRGGNWIAVAPMMACCRQQGSHEKLRSHQLPPRAEPPQHERGELEVDVGVLFAAGHLAYTFDPFSRPLSSP